MKKVVLGLCAIVTTIVMSTSCGQGSTAGSSDDGKESSESPYSISFLKCEMTKDGTGKAELRFQNHSTETLERLISVTYTMSSGGVIYGEGFAQTSEDLLPNRSVIVQSTLYPTRVVTMLDVGPMTCSVKLASKR